MEPDAQDTVGNAAIAQALGERQVFDFSDIDAGEGLHGDTDDGEIFRLDGDAGGTAAAGGTTTPTSSGGLPVRLTVRLGSFSQPQNVNVAQVNNNWFGLSKIQAGFGQVSFTTNADHIAMDGAVNLTCPWGINSRGRRNVENAQSSEVTPSTWTSVVLDLRPRGIGRPRRDTYWCQPLSERHERYHGTDDRGYVQSSGLSLMQTRAGQLTLPANPTQAQARPVVIDLLQTVLRGANTHYGGSSITRGDGNVPGERRAYGDGTPGYEAIVRGVMTRARQFVGPRGGRTASLDDVDGDDAGETPPDGGSTVA